MININKINELKSLCIDINAYELDININDELDNLIEKLQVYIREEKDDDKVIDLLNKVKDKAGLNGCSAKVEELIKLFLVYDFDITEKEIYNKIPHLDKSTVRDAIKLLSIKKVINEHEDFDGEIKYYTFNERILDNNKTDEKNKINNTIKSNIEAYKKYNEAVLNDLSQIINDFFNFHVEIDNGKIDFQMGGCDYNVYLSRGYIVLEEADNSTIDNVWTTESIEEFIDLIKDLKEDN